MKIEAGDQVRCINAGHTDLRVGEVYTALQGTDARYVKVFGAGGVGGYIHSRFELVASASREPVTIVTRKQINDGDFGRIRVLALGGKKVGLRFTSADNAQIAALDSTELTAAIATLTAIRDALDEVA